ncbi:hypothetical protein QWZ04_22560 [Vibrio tapetis subsp. quintayensis]|uniref:hypothetical protein n=1 Tax=Vibrio tapetis TaxID=52443 RepID=UPI0025B40494|nr:hypothetical protein [Vibrio tapetis]MDN3683093.1 hypothetical protein [Vibrio tapetis subsp. quintayensis]
MGNVTNKRIDIAFLHTGEVHVNTFDVLVKKKRSSLNISHCVMPELLTHAIELGIDHDLKSTMFNTINNLSQNARMVVCTCSSIGGVAEEFDGLNNTIVKRIDRAMADKAVLDGNKILVAAALQSTIDPTIGLILDSATKVNKNIIVSHSVIPDAWAYFEQGDMTTYHQSIARYLNTIPIDADIIVLAQASMAGCSTYFTKAIPILSSPDIGVTEAITSLS